MAEALLEPTVDHNDESWAGGAPGVTVATLVERINNLSNQVTALRESEEQRHRELRMELKDRYATMADLADLKTDFSMRTMWAVVGTVLTVIGGVVILLLTRP